MSHRIERTIVEYALADAGLDGDALYEAYSGRAMYGEKCFGIVGNVAAYTRFVIALSAAADETELWLDSVVVDNMGLDKIWYWPSVQLEG